MLLSILKLLLFPFPQMKLFTIQILVMIFLFCLEARVLNSQNLTCNSNDMKVLEDFLNGLHSGIDGWDLNASSPNCCNWPGITCSSSLSLDLLHDDDDDNDTINSGRVVKLELPGRRLNGQLPESLGRLDKLRTLNLSNNFLQSSLPASLLQLPHLEFLDMRNNWLNGPLPDSINLPSVLVFDVSDNNLKGSIPVGICNNSTRVSVLNLSSNYFYGSLFPGLGNCTSLEDLNLVDNDLTGGLPEDLFLLKGLAKLFLQSNKLSRRLPERVGNLSNLVYLDISLNNFSGHIPDVFQNFGQLRYFSAQSNNFVGEIPESMMNSQTVTRLYLSNNSLDGQIRINCSAMTDLALLDLGSNKFTGQLPGSLATCRQLKTLDLSRNNFTCQIPESFKNLKSLSMHSLSNTSIYNLSAALGILQHCKNLTILILTLSFRNEELPSDRSLHFNELKALIAANCGLTGFVPQWLNGCGKLQFLDLSWNRLRGKVPPWFGDLQFMFYLDLSNNSLSGEIPVELTRLQSLISGNISLVNPFSDLGFFMKRNAGETALQYKRLQSFPPTIDLSNNILTGPIWPQFGNLKYLHVLDLKFNNLTGTIPGNLSGLTNIETLDLSHNNLHGSIPASLVALSFLSEFSVAYNRLSGIIPSGGQFSTFLDSIYEGNADLCGVKLNPCKYNNTQIPEESLGNLSEKLEMATFSEMAIGVGVFFFFVSFVLEMYTNFVWNFLISRGLLNVV